MKNFRLLESDEIECRVQRITEKGVTLLLYKTARTDADLLDETVGCDKWENDFKLVDGVLYGGLGVDYGNGFIWKWDAGTESNTEAEKGRASDAFKRAGFKHGIGRELYSAPFVFVPAGKCNIKEDKKGKLVCYNTFAVSEIEYDEKERISRLVITCDGSVVYFWARAALPTTKPAPQPEVATDLIFCDDCGMEIRPTMDKKGRELSAQYVADYSRGRFGRCLCADCQRKAATA